MWRFLVLVFCYQVLSQPVTDEVSRQRREIIECCPCPSNGNEDTLGRSSQIGRENVDDCPCRARSADSEGASSILFPSSVRPDGPHLRPFNSKDEQKNLLEPEVGLATSMLQTLREATEEEYRDALARDAARSATGLDETDEDSKNLVIIVNPRTSDDDTLGEASHVQESRCLHPLGSSPLAKMRTQKPTEPNLLPDIFKLPRLRQLSLPHKNLLDMDSTLGASNVEEKVMDLNSVAPITKLKPTSLFRSSIPFKSKLFGNKNEENLNGDVQISKPTTLIRSNIPFKSKLFAKTNNDSDSNHLSTLKSSLLSKPKIKPLFDGLRLPLVPKMRDTSTLQKGNDLSPAPSTVQEVSDDPDEKLAVLPSFTKRPTLLKNIWKLKDVELIPPFKLPKKPALKLPNTTVPMLRSTNFKDDYDDNASSELRDVIKSEVKPNDLENTMSGTSLISVDDNNCTNAISILNNQNEDLLHSPSNVNPSAFTNTEVPNVSQERDASSITDIEPLPSEDLPKSTEVETTRIDEKCKDASEPKLTADRVGNVNNLENDFINDDNIENSETPLEYADVADRDDSLDQDSFTDTSIINSIIAEPEIKVEGRIRDQSEDDGVLLNPPNGSVDESNIPQNIDPTSDASFPSSMFKPIPSLTETLSSIRENIKKLDLFINPSKTLTSEEINEDIAKYENEIKEKDSTDNSNFVFENNETKHVTDNDEEQPKSTESTDQNVSNSVTLEDLQKLSDDLLDSSSNQEQKTSSPTNTDGEPLEPQSNFQDLQKVEKTDSENIADKPLPKFEQELNERSGDNFKEDACPNNLDLTSAQKREDPLQIKSTDQETEPSDMKTEASESIISTLPNILDPLNLSDKLKFLPFENKNVPPNLPTDPFNLLNNPLDDNIMDLNPKLPTLDDIRNQLSNVISTDTNERSNNESQEECDYDEDEIEKMAPGASTTNSQIKLPTIKPKENSDLFQLGSLKSSQRNTLGTNKKNNLNSYRAKVPVPKSLEFKPIKLESNGRSKDGVLRTPLKLNERRTMVRNKLSNSKLPSKLNLLGDPAMTFPSLDQLKDALQTSPNRLLGDSFQPNLNILRSSPISDYSDNLRLNAEKTFKSLQKKMRTSLRGSQISEPLAKPQELLEDVSDKLKAIQYDLNDRLASVHDNILDTSKLQLPTTLLRTPDNLLNKNLMKNLRIAKQKPLRMQTLASSISSREVNGPDLKPIARKQDSFQVKSNTPSKLFKSQEFAASAPTTIRLENPILGKDNDRFTLPRFAERAVPSIDPKSKTSISKPVFRNPNFKDSRVTITFGSTTPSSLRSAHIPVTSPPPTMEKIGFPLAHHGGFPLAHHPSSKSPLNERSLVTKSTQMPNKFTSKLKDFENRQRDNPNLKLTKKNPVFSSQILRTVENDANKLKSLGDVMKERISNYNSLKHSKVPKIGSSDEPRVKIDNTQNTVKSNPGMLRSASENTDVVVSQEPLKENVSYKCRLVCTKE